MTETTRPFEFQQENWIRRNRRNLIRYGLIVLLLYFVFYLIWFYVSLPEVGHLVKENPKHTALMQLRVESAKEQGKTLKIKQRWVAFEHIPDLLKKAVRIAEDASFYQHEGVDLEELKESIKKNLEEGKLARGGSTITQQLAKNLYLSTDKSFIRKIREYFIAKRLERTLSKNRIFHLYLNIIELGPGVFGVGAASQYYFGKHVSTLSLDEIIRLTAIIPRPLVINPKSNSRWLRWKSKWILRKMKQYKYIDNQLYDDTIANFE